MRAASLNSDIPATVADDSARITPSFEENATLPPDLPGQPSTNQQQAATAISKNDDNERMLPTVWQQCTAIMYHAWLLKWASKGMLAMEIVLPLLAMALVILMKPNTQTVATNISKVLTFKSVSLHTSSGESYLAGGRFVPMSQLAVSPNTPTTIAIAKNVFKCVLQHAGYVEDGATKEWYDPNFVGAAGANTRETNILLKYVPTWTMANEDDPTIKSVYVIDKSTRAFSTAKDAVRFIGSPKDKFQYVFQTRSPVALVFDDGEVTKASYSLYFNREVTFVGPIISPVGYKDRLPMPYKGDACLSDGLSALPADVSQTYCTHAYSNCITDQSCQVMYNATYFSIPEHETLCLTDKYLYTGEVILQHCVDTELMRLHTTLPSLPMPLVSMQMLPKVAGRPPSSIDNSKDPRTFFLMLSCGGFTMIFIVGQILAEKERKLKQALCMMGVSPVAYWLGWFLVNLCIWIAVELLLILLIFLSFRMSPLQDADIIMTLLVILLGGVNAIIMAFMFSTFFNRSITAVLIAMCYILFSALIFMSVALVNQHSGCVGTGMYWILSLLGNYALLIALERMMVFCELGGVGWSDFGTHYQGRMSIGEAFMMQIFDIILYILLTYYFDQVLPNEYGTSRHPLFFCDSKFWRSLFNKNNLKEAQDGLLDDTEHMRTVHEQVVAELSANPDVEPVDKAATFADVGIVTSRLCKKYDSSKGQRVAVDQLSMIMYKNQITAVLGHNGAGKTTTIRMLTGQIPPTSGVAYILNHDVHKGTGLHAVQATLGVCPQDDVIWPSLTVAQHLRFIGRLKGMTISTAEQTGRKLLEQVDLSQKWQARSSTLSGGQKRRLCLVLALMGEPQVVFLDEPSSGVDPYTRRKIWDMLGAYKRSDRCIVLTTHNMYEADVLADRKLIVSKGKLRCAGSSVYLKNHFGVGYYLNIELNPVKNDDDSTQEGVIKWLKAEISQIVPTVSFPAKSWERNDFKQICALLPKEEINRYQDLFRLIESDKVTAAVVDTGIAAVSMNDIFIKLCDDADKSAAQTLDRPSMSETRASTGSNSNSGLQLYCSKFGGMLRLRFLLWLRSPIRYAFALSLTIAILFVSTYMETLLKNASKEAVVIERKGLSPADLNYWRDVLMTKDSTHPVVIHDARTYSKVAAALNTFKMRDARLADGKTYEDLVEHAKQQKFFVGADIGAWPTSGDEQRSAAAEYTVWYDGTFYHAAALALNVMNSLYYNTVTGRASGISIKIYQTNEGELYNDTSEPVVEDRTRREYNDDQNAGMYLPMLFTLAISFLVSFFVVDAANDRQNGTIRLLRLSGVWGILYWLPILVVHVIFYILPAMIAFAIFAGIWPMALSASSAASCMFAMHTILFIVVLTLLMYRVALMFNGSGAAFSVVLMLNFMFAVGAGYASTMVTAYSYYEETVFSKQTTTTTTTTTTLAPTVDGFPTQVPRSHEFDVDIFGIIHMVLAIFVPHFAFAGGLTTIATAYYVMKDETYTLVENDHSYWSDTYNICLIGLLLWLGIAICTLFASELRSSGVGRSWLFSFGFRSVGRKRIETLLDRLSSSGSIFNTEKDEKNSENEEEEEEEDVRDERILSAQTTSKLVHQQYHQRDATDDFTQTPAITALGLNKRYGRKFVQSIKNLCKIFVGKKRLKPDVAVQSVSFRVLPNEIFGLLGPNGAGKTTTMSMLTKETAPTAGVIHVDRFNTTTNWTNAHKYLGYCPQHDALWGQLTVAEHLDLYARLHGKRVQPNDRIYRMSRQLGLGEYSHVKTKKLSGGTKRKVCFLISIIDDRNMTSLLDEPSSGMDPSSARHLWDVIKQHFKGRSTQGRVSTGGVLTTHYMEEAEALCDRIAIMAKGNIKCIGSPMHLRNKFGSGYRLELRLVDGQDATRDAVVKVILQQFSAALLNSEESRMNRLVFSLPQHEALPLSRSFAFLESLRVDEQLELEVQHNALEDQPLSVAAKSDRKVLEYTIGQASIEHVFLRFAAQQQQHDKEQENP